MNIRMTIQYENSSFPWQFTGHALTIGRDAQCDLPLPNSGMVSGRHARLEYAGQHWMLTDAGSRNGTYLNGQLVQGTQPVRTGDVVRLGPSGPQLNITEAREPFAMQGPAGRVSSKSPAAQTPSLVQHAVPGSSSPSPTRVMLRQVLSQQKRNRLLRVAACMIVVAAASLFMIFGVKASNEDSNSPVTVAVKDENQTPAAKPKDEKTPNTNPKSDDPEPEPEDDLFDRLVRHTVHIGPLGGSGSIFNMKRKLIVTNYHVVGKLSEVQIRYPKWGPDGELLRHQKDYFENGKFTVGKVLIREPKKDIAVVQVDYIPPTARVIRFVQQSAKSGTHINLVGGKPDGSGNAMWEFVEGRVRSVTFHQRFLVGDHSGKLSHIVTGHLVRSTMRSQGGTSGGGVFNDAGEYVALNFAGRMRGDRFHLDVRDVRRFLYQHGYLAPCHQP